MDLENDPWQRAAEILHASSDVWGSPEFAAAFPEGVEKVASAVVYTIGTDEVQWVETRADLEAPKVEAAIFAGSRVVHAMLTGHGFGFEVRRLTVTGLRATSTPFVHPTPGADPQPFRFTADIDGMQVDFPWDPENTKQDSDMHEQFQRLLALLV
ncbi:hypothetical protein BH11ACT3_BH11ACT3_08230 [soil metagenome]